MRKLLSIVLCLVMVFCFTVPAMAAEVDMKDGATPVDSEVLTTQVNVVIDKEDPVYKVVVTWDNPMQFEYNFGTWNTTTLVYDKGWDTTLGLVRTVELENYSNASVKVVPTLSANNATNGVTFTLSSNEIVLDSADVHNGAAVGEVQDGAFTLTVGGAPNDITVDTFEETLTLTISK